MSSGFQLGQLVADDSAAPLALDEVVDHAALDRARTIERIEGSQVFHRDRLIPAQHIAHAAGLKLKHAGSERAVKDLLVGLRIVQRNQRHIEHAATLLLNQLERVVNYGEGGEPEKVHLQQAQFFHRLHVIGSDDFVVLAATDRHQLGERLGRDYDSGGMQTGAAHKAFKLSRGVDQLLYLRLFVVGLLHLRRILQRLGDGDANRRRHHLGHAVHFAVGQVECPADVLDGSPGGHGVEGNDLRDLFPAVLAGDIVDHFATPVHAEVNVDVRHGHALRIQKAFKKEFVLQRVDVGDFHGVRHQRSGGRAAARSHGDIEPRGRT